ncbi:MAG: tetratricopeptide repeat protein, partial [Planctomycetia bacterium]|nr:tetratricopeptide repeat protein [Planctomycetia bacterium]
IRLDLADLELELENYAQAEYQARRALEQAPEDRHALRLAALACYHQFTAGEPKAEEVVRAMMEQARSANPGDSVLAQAFATFCREAVRELDRSQCVELADRAMDEMVAGQPDRAISYLCRYQYRKKYNVPNALDDLRRAADLDASDVGVRLAMAEHEFESENWPAAISLFTELVKKTKQPEAYWRLGQCYAAIGEPESAVSTWETGLARDSESVVLNLELAGWFIAGEQPERAAPLLDDLEDLVPGHLSIDQTDSNSAYWLEKETLRARWHLCCGRSRKAIELLRTAMARSPALEEASSTERLLEIWQLLGRAHRELRQWDQAAHAFAKVAELVPNSVTHKLAVAGALADAGRRTEAIHYCQQAMVEFPDVNALWLALAEMQLEQQRHLIRPARNLASVHETLDRVSQLAESDWRLTIYRADTWLLAESDTLREQALQHLRAAETRHAEDSQFWRQLAFRYANLEDADGVERALVHRSSLIQDPRERILARAELQMYQGNLDEARKTLQLLTNPIDKATQQAVQALLIRLELQAGNFSAAHAHLLARHVDRPGDVDVVWEVGKLALRVQNWGEVRERELELRSLEGEQGCCWRWLKACSLLGQLDGADDPRMLQVMSLQDFIGAQSPEWPLSKLLKARVCERRDHIEEAIAAYTAAVAGGVEEPLAYDRLIQLLCQQRQVELAWQYLGQVHKLLPWSLERSAVIERGEASMNVQGPSPARPRGDAPSDHTARKKLAFQPR